jgi:hypothetical protein
VTTLRRLLLQYNALAAGLLGLALAMRLLVPIGFMPMQVGGTITLQLCSGFGPQPMAPATAMAGMHHGETDQGPHHGKADKAETPCAFAGLSAPSLAATDPAMLAVALLFIVAVGRRTITPIAPGAPPRLRPPSRGPPAAR